MDHHLTSLLMNDCQMIESFVVVSSKVIWPLKDLMLALTDTLHSKG